MNRHLNPRTDPGHEENQYGSNPASADADDDNLSDMEEAALETDSNDADTDDDGADDGEDAVPLDAEINWPKTPENRYVWIEQVAKTGAKAVSRHGHILFPESNGGSSALSEAQVLWDSGTSSWVELAGASSWSGSGFESGEDPDVFDHAWDHIDDMNDDGVVVGRSKYEGPYAEVAWVLASAIMKWQMSGTATDQYAEPLYIVPGFTYIDPWGDLEKSLMGEAPRIADDGTVSAMSYHVSYPTLSNWSFETKWVTGGAHQTNHSGEMAVWSAFDGYCEDVYHSGAVLGNDAGLLVEYHSDVPKTVLHYRNGAAAESLEGILPNSAHGIRDTDIGRTPATSENPEGRIWFSVNHAGGDDAFLEKRAGGSGVTRWHNPPSMGEGAIRLNARGEAITSGRIATQTAPAIPPKLWRNGKYTDLNELTSKPSSVTITQAIDLASNGIILAQATENNVTKTGLLVPVEIDSNWATIRPKFRGDLSNPYLCNNIDHIAAGEKIEGALTIYHKAVRDENGETDNFDVILKAAPIGNITWTKTKGPDSGELVDSNTPTAIFRNPKKGGLYEFELSIGEQSSSCKLQLWLPAAGPDISSYWGSEIAYFKNTWGPAYRAKLNDRTVLHAMNPPLRWMLKKELAAKDLFTIGGVLDWNGEIRGDETPCGGPVSTPGNRLTLHGFVISWSKRNNMLYALIGREMGLPERTLINAGHVVNIASSGGLDSAETVESYRAGFDLFDGVSLGNVMKSRGLKMHQPDGWDQWEWPSHEASEEELQRMADQALQELIQ